MKKYYKKMLYFILAMLFGIFMFVYGEYDNSPGGQWDPPVLGNRSIQFSNRSNP